MTTATCLWHCAFWQENGSFRDHCSVQSENEGAYSLQLLISVRGPKPGGGLSGASLMALGAGVAPVGLCSLLGSACFLLLTGTALLFSGTSLHSPPTSSSICEHCKFGPAWYCKTPLKHLACVKVALAFCECMSLLEAAHVYCSIKHPSDLEKHHRSNVGSILK